jgi:hypothetical protein
MSKPCAATNSATGSGPASLPCWPRGNIPARLVARPVTTASWSMVSFGSCTPAPPGVISPNALVPGKRSSPASTAGAGAGPFRPEFRPHRRRGRDHPPPRRRGQRHRRWHRRHRGPGRPRQQPAAVLGHTLQQGQNPSARRAHGPPSGPVAAVRRTGTDGGRPLFIRAGGWLAASCGFSKKMRIHARFSRPNCDVLLGAAWGASADPESATVSVDRGDVRRKRPGCIKLDWSWPWS